MKNIFAIALAIVATTFFGNTTTTFAQDAHIVHYEATGKLDSKRPDFTNTVVAIDLRGPLAEDAKRIFRKLGVKDFSESSKGSACNIAQTVICLSVERGPGVQVTSYGSNSGYSNSGGVYSQGSFSGKLYSINLIVTLIRYNADGSRSSLIIGETSTLAPEGASTETISSFGRNGGGSFMANTSGGLDATIGNAISKDLTDLFGSGFARVVIASKIRSPWMPGANVEVKNAFAPKP